MAGFGTTIVFVTKGTEPLLIIIGGNANESITLLVVWSIYEVKVFGIAVVLMRSVLLLRSAEKEDPSLAWTVLNDETGKMELILSHRVVPPPLEIRK